MSRERERSASHSLDSIVNFSRLYHHIFFGNTLLTTGVKYAGSFTVWDKHEEMQDCVREKNLKPNKYRPWLNPVHACDHTKNRIEYANEKFVLQLELVDPGWEETHETQAYDSALHYALWNYSGSLTGTNPPDLNPLNSVGAYQEVAWPVLLDSFREACNSLVDQAFFLGEDAVETTPILVSAFKCLLNPSSAIRTTVKLMSKILKTRSARLKALKALPLHNLTEKEFIWRKSVNAARRIERKRLRRAPTLGDLKDLVKGTVNADLAYKFAIKPAIADFRSSLDAHSVIEKRLRFIESKRGTFVPIKVRRKFSSTVGSYTTPDRHDTAASIFDAYTERDRIGMISCWAKVRSDITVQPRWAAYTEYFGLNKILGTVWELIPFSFVIDWVTNAQEMVNKMTRFSVSNPYTEFTSIMYTTLERTRITRYVFPPVLKSGYTITAPSTPQVLYVHTQRAYSRMLNYPGSSPILDFSGIGKAKLLSLGELAIQFIR
jgi:hypothetical protein